MFFRDKVFFDGFSLGKIFVLGIMGAVRWIGDGEEMWYNI